MSTPRTCHVIHKRVTLTKSHKIWTKSSPLNSKEYADVRTAIHSNHSFRKSSICRWKCNYRYVFVSLNEQWHVSLEKRKPKSFDNWIINHFNSNSRTRNKSISKTEWHIWSSNCEFEMCMQTRQIICTVHSLYAARSSIENQQSRPPIHNKKVKCYRYRTCVAQRVGRGITLLFHDRGTRRVWVVSSTPLPQFIPGKDPVSTLQEATWAPGPVWTGGKSRPHRDSIPNRPARSQSLYRLSYPAQAN